MGRRPFKCYRICKGKPFPKSRYNRSVPDPKIRAYDIGNVKANYDDLPICVNLVSKKRTNFFRNIRSCSCCTK